MNIINIIEAKRDGEKLNREQISYFVKCAADGSIPDYQISAFLMAVFLRGMDDEETAWLTREMAFSGPPLDLPEIGKIIIDKHSSGGVGDKTTLVVAPMVAACGLAVAKMSGRGLGFSGGTLDKLESIAGFRIDIPRKDFIEYVQRDGISIIGQTEDIAPVDKKLYAIRDVTGTVESIPLIAASIMSKKLAVKSDSVVLDVKTGNGAFMRNLDDAVSLAQKMVAIGKENNRPTYAAITDMNCPLGYAVGNALEVAEAVETLKGNGKIDLVRICKKLGSLMLIAGGLAFDEEQAGKKLEWAIESGAAYEKFRRMIINQGGDVKMIDDTSLLPKAKFIREIKALSSGYIAEMDTEAIGRASVGLGAGRREKTDVIDHTAGLIIEKKTGDYVAKNDVLAYVHANGDYPQICEEVRKAYTIVENPVPQRKLIYATVNGSERIKYED